MLPKKLLFTVGRKTKNGTATSEDNLAGILFFVFFIKLNILSPYDPAIVLMLLDLPTRFVSRFSELGG